MKKLLCVLLTIVLLLSSTAAFANPGKKHDSKWKSDGKSYYQNDDESTSIFINGKEYLFNDGYVINYSGFQIPVKPIEDGLGASVDWNEKTYIVTIKDGNISLVMNLKNKVIKVNGFEIKNSVLTTNKKNRTIALIKFIAEVLGKNTEVNEGAGIVIVDDNGSNSINDNIMGTGLNQFEYSGKWNYGTQKKAYLEDNHWSSDRDSYYKVKFIGNQIKLYGAKANHHGIAAVSIDNGQEIDIDLYSAERGDNVLIYSSPNLKEGQHTLKVRVTGTKNRKSKGTNITADRVIVFSKDSKIYGNNIALNKKSFSDSQQSENPDYKGNDGNISTRWCAADESVNHWWTVDLGSMYDISGSEVIWEKSGKVYKYKIEVSPDNWDWKLKVNKSSNTIKQKTQTDRFSAKSVRFVRITVTGLESGCWASFSEFKVFGDNINTKSDYQAPTTPTTLVVTAPVSNEAAINWNASYDNKGIAGYKVYRDGSEIADVSSGTSYRDRGLTAGTVYVYSIVAYDAAGNFSNHSELAYVKTPGLNNSNYGYGNGNGLKGEYYNNKNFSDLKFSRTDETIDKNWEYYSPDFRIDRETYSVRWTGQIQPLYSEEYTFITTSDDGVRLWVNGSMIIDNWTDHSETEDYGTVRLTAGQKYIIRLDYYNSTGSGKINLRWSSSSQSEEIVPKSQLYSAAIDTQSPSVPERLSATAVSSTQINLSWMASTDNEGIAGYKVYRDGVLVKTVNNSTTYADTGLNANTTYKYAIAAFDSSGNNSQISSNAVAKTSASAPQVSTGNGNGLKGEYYNNIDFTSLVKQRVDESINFNWRKNAPISNMGQDEFSVRWTGQIQPLYSETYTFNTISDDGARLWINGIKVIDNWYEHSSKEESGTIALVAGQKYDIKYEYFDKTGEAEVKLFWSSPSQNKQIVPKSQLYCSDVDSQAPSVPQNMAAVTVSHNQINLSWTAAVDNIGVIVYRIYRNGNLVQNVYSGTNCTETGLAENTTYSYTIDAVDAAGNSSGQSSPVTVSTRQLKSNLASGKTVISDSVENGNPATNGNDDNINTRWCAADGGVNHWWQVDLGRNLELTGTEIIWEKSKVYKYKIEVSSDSINWAVAVDNTGNTKSEQTQKDTFSANNIRYVRITVTGLEADTWASFYELKVY